MKLHTLKTLFQHFTHDLKKNCVESVYLYGSQVDLVRDSSSIPKGKEIDLVFVKHGRLRDGEKPIEPSLSEKIFSLSNYFVHTFNGVWGECVFDNDHYYFDILGEGSENIIDALPSAKVFSLKRKILVWGKEVSVQKVSLSDLDKSQLVEVMSRYVKREFFTKDSPQNRKSIYKNALFIISLKDEELIQETSRDTLIELLKESPLISKAIKENIDKLIDSYHRGSFSGLCATFDRLVDLNE